MCDRANATLTSSKRPPRLRDLPPEGVLPIGALARAVISALCEYANSDVSKWPAWISKTKYSAVVGSCFTGDEPSLPCVAWIGIQTLTDHTGLSESGVHKAIKICKQVKAIEPIYPSDATSKGGRHATCYLLTLHRVEGSSLNTLQSRELNNPTLHTVEGSGANSPPEEDQPSTQRSPTLYQVESNSPPGAPHCSNYRTNERAIKTSTSSAVDQASFVADGANSLSEELKEPKMAEAITAIQSSFTGPKLSGQAIVEIHRELRAYGVTWQHAAIAWRQNAGGLNQAGGFRQFVRNWEVSTIGVKWPACLDCEDRGTTDNKFPCSCPAGEQWLKRNPKAMARVAAREAGAHFCEHCGNTGFDQFDLFCTLCKLGPKKEAECVPLREVKLSASRNPEKGAA